MYRATDTKLKRQVAIKILPPSLAADHDRLARFQREAEVLASLNHPNIAAIHGLEESGGMTALVMELVEGDDLSQRIARGAIPLDDALPIAKQIAEALEAAHEQGIIHRDLKPANIKVRADGTVKVLDFGLAKAMEPVGAAAASASMSPTLSLHATQAGMILGTAAYMSPEQARGKTVDKRADIWAFGCVLFEMLAGRRAFEGDDVPEILSRVLQRDPDWARLPANLPPSIPKLLRLCLQKDVRTAATVSGRCADRSRTSVGRAGGGNRRRDPGARHARGVGCGRSHRADRRSPQYSRGAISARDAVIHAGDGRCGPIEHPPSGQDAVYRSECSHCRRAAVGLIPGWPGHRVCRCRSRRETHPLASIVGRRDGPFAAGY